MFAQPTPAREWISVSQAAEILQCTDRFIRKLIASGELPAYKVGVKMVRVKPADVAALIQPVAVGGDDAA